MHTHIMHVSVRGSLQKDLVILFALFEMTTGFWRHHVTLMGVFLPEG